MRAKQLGRNKPHLFSIPLADGGSVAATFHWPILTLYRPTRYADLKIPTWCDFSMINGIKEMPWLLTAHYPGEIT